MILARALAQQPSLLLLDEPTQHLDIGGKVELLRRLRRLADENRYTVVVVTHELNLAAEFSDRIVLLHKGKCLRIGDACGSVSAGSVRRSVRSAAGSGDALERAAARDFAREPTSFLAASGVVAANLSTAPSTITRDSAHGKTVKNRRRRATVRRNFSARTTVGSEGSRKDGDSERKMGRPR